MEEALEFGVEPGPVVITRDQNKKNAANADAADAPKPPPTQAVLAFTMKVSFFLGLHAILLALAIARYGLN